MKTSDRMNNVHRSHIREILKVTGRPEVISFAGGLPHPDSFPVQAVRAAADAVLAEEGANALQYSTTEGFPPLREFISARYAQKLGIDVPPDEIVITTGSQQGIDLAAKALVNPGEPVIIERPGYLGAIQSFSMYEPEFRPIELTSKGIDTRALEEELAAGARVFYGVPNFQNPSGATYDLETRKRTAELITAHDAVFLEDNPYGELRFLGDDLPPVRAFAPANTLLMGSFSKIVSPGLRVGWICAPRPVLDKLVTAKQAADLHTSSLTQRILHRLLIDGDLDGHIEKIKEKYLAQREVMVAMLRTLFPPEVTFTEPEGGMFLWVTLPGGITATRLFEESIKDNVAFVPGKPFYVDDEDSSLRLNFSNTSEATIEEGMSRLAKALERVMGRKAA